MQAAATPECRLDREMRVRRRMRQSGARARGEVDHEAVTSKAELTTKAPTNHPYLEEDVVGCSMHVVFPLAGARRWRSHWISPHWRLRRRRRGALTG